MSTQWTETALHAAEDTYNRCVREQAEAAVALAAARRYWATRIGLMISGALTMLVASLVPVLDISDGIDFSPFAWTLGFLGLCMGLAAGFWLAADADSNRVLRPGERWKDMEEAMSKVREAKTKLDRAQGRHEEAQAEEVVARYQAPTNG